MEQAIIKAHKVAYALSRKLGVEINVRRMPLTKTHVAFEFVTGKYAGIFGQGFLDGDLAAFATRLMTEIEGASRGTAKSHAGRKG